MEAARTYVGFFCLQVSYVLLHTSLAPWFQDSLTVEVCLYVLF